MVIDNPIWTDDKAVKLAESLLTGKIDEIKPTIRVESKLGFNYPQAEKLLDTNTEQIVAILEPLEAAGILTRKFADKLLFA